MWKLLIKFLDKPEYVNIPNEITYTNGLRQNNKDARGFSLMSNAVSYMNSKQFVDHINGVYGYDVEIVEVLIKFEDLQ